MGLWKNVVSLATFLHLISVMLVQWVVNSREVFLEKYQINLPSSSEVEESFVLGNLLSELIGPCTVVAER